MKDVSKIQELLDLFNTRGFRLKVRGAGKDSWSNFGLQYEAKAFPSKNPKTFWVVLTNFFADQYESAGEPPVHVSEIANVDDPPAWYIVLTTVTGIELRLETIFKGHDFESKILDKERPKKQAAFRAYLKELYAQLAEELE